MSNEPKVDLAGVDELVGRLRDDWPEILVEKHWMMDSDAIDEQREEAATALQSLAAQLAEARVEIERLREALTTIFHEGGQAEARFALAALGDWKSEAGDLGGKQ